jgi:hypothetical protein
LILNLDDGGDDADDDLPEGGVQGAGVTWAVSSSLTPFISSAQAHIIYLCSSTFPFFYLPYPLEMQNSQDKEGRKTIASHGDQRSKQKSMHSFGDMETRGEGSKQPWGHGGPWQSALKLVGIWAVYLDQQTILAGLNQQKRGKL